MLGLTDVQRNKPTASFGHADETDDPGSGPVKVLTVREVAQYLRVHPSTLYKMLQRNNLPAFKVGSDWRFNREEVDRWIQSRMEGQKLI
jgi:excisionase family DNA binding protein